MASHRPQNGTTPENIETGQKKQSVSNGWLIIGLISLAVLFIITRLVISNVTQSLDARLALIINNMSLGSSLNAMMILASKYGREYFWIPVVGLMLIFGKRDTKMLAVELAALFVAGIVAGEAMKFVMYRARPFETVSGIITRVPTDTDSSYPSGHAIIVSIGAIFSLLKFRRKSLALVLALEAVIVSYSRVYVGMHYPLDVISGIFLGGFIVFVGLFALERSSYLKKIVDAFTNLAQRILRGGLVSI